MLNKKIQKFITFCKETEASYPKDRRITYFQYLNADFVVMDIVRRVRGFPYPAFYLDTALIEPDKKAILLKYQLRWGFDLMPVVNRNILVKLLNTREPDTHRYWLEELRRDAFITIVKKYGYKIFQPNVDFTFEEAKEYLKAKNLPFYPRDEDEFLNASTLQEFFNKTIERRPDLTDELNEEQQKQENEESLRQLGLQNK